MSGFFVRILEQQEKKMCQCWIRFLVMKNWPMPFVDCPYTRDIACLKAVSAQTIWHHILSLARDVMKETFLQSLKIFDLFLTKDHPEFEHCILAVKALIVENETFEAAVADADLKRQGAIRGSSSRRSSSLATCCWGNSFQWRCPWGQWPY